MADLNTAQILDQLVSMQGRVARQEAELARYRRRRVRPFLPLLAVGLLVALAPLAVLAANPFNDLNPNSVHNANIDAIYTAGVTTGCDPNVSYCPNGLVTREEMASFLARLGGLGDNKPVASAARLASSPTSIGAPTFAANDLVRVASGGPVAVAPTLNRDAFTILATVKITVPGPGFMLVTGGALVEGNGGAVVRLRDNSADTSALILSPILAATVDPATPVNSATLSYVFPVTAAGAKSYVIEAIGPDTVDAGGASAQITALYVPFGSTGGTTP